MADDKKSLYNPSNVGGFLREKIYRRDFAYVAVGCVCSRTGKQVQFTWKGLLKFE